jgi:hypothetical protein
MSSLRTLGRRAFPFLALVACASPTSRPTTQLLNFGIVKLVGPFERHPDPNTAVGFTSSGPGRSVFEKQTTEVPAVRGVAFGIRYRIEGISPRDPVIVEEIIRHPDMIRPDRSVIREERTTTEAVPRDGVFDQKFLYLLQEPYEVVRVIGRWSWSSMGRRRSSSISTSFARRETDGLP